MSATARPRRPGRRPIVAGVVMMVVAATAMVGAFLAWAFLGGPDSDGAVVFEMPGSTSATMTEGDWALYSQEVDGTQQVAYVDDITVTGPEEVGVESTVGFFEDTTSITVDGTDYQVFARLDVPTDGTYDVAITEASATTTVVLGQYTTDDNLALVVLGVVVGGVLLGAAGFVTLVVGLILRSRGRQGAAPTTVA